MATDPTGNSVIPSDSSSPIATTGSQTPLRDLLNEALTAPARNEFQPPELGIVNPSSAQPGLNKSNFRTGPTILIIDSPGVNHPIPGGHKHHSDSPLQEVHRLLDRATEGYAQRQGHGRLYALLWAKDCSIHCDLSQFPAGFESDNGNYYLSGLHLDPIGRLLPGPTADTKISLWHFAPSKEELKYFSNFARDAGAALLRLRPSWLDVRNPTPESDCLWVEALFFHPPSGESQGDPTFPKPLSIMNPWVASMLLLRTMLDATQHRSTVPGETEQLPVVATPSAIPPAVAAGKPTTKRDAPAGKRKKRSTTRGKGQTKLLSALAVHHRYGQPCGLLNLESIGCRALAKAVGVAPATASKFFKDNFGSLTSYEGICRDAKGLHAKLKLLYDDFADPSYGSEPNEGDE